MYIQSSEAVQIAYVKVQSKETTDKEFQKRRQIRSLRDLSGGIPGRGPPESFALCSLQVFLID